MLNWLLPGLVAIVATIAFLLPLYRKLLVDLEGLNEETFIRLGRPTLFMASPRRGLALQRFIYSASQDPDVHPTVARRCRFLAFAMPVSLLLIAAAFVWGAARI